MLGLFPDLYRSHFHYNHITLQPLWCRTSENLYQTKTNPQGTERLHSPSCCSDDAQIARGCELQGKQHFMFVRQLSSSITSEPSQGTVPGKGKQPKLRRTHPALLKTVFYLNQSYIVTKHRCKFRGWGNGGETPSQQLARSRTPSRRQVNLWFGKPQKQEDQIRILQKTLCTDFKQHLMGR